MLPFERLKKRIVKRRAFAAQEAAAGVKPSGTQVKTGEPSSTDLIFPKRHGDLFKIILDEGKLRFDREGEPRTFYSLRQPTTS